MHLTFPEKARFAFTILDDTDDATVENVRPIYELLFKLGFRTTKTVWPVACPEGSELFFAGKTLADQEYLAFVRDLAGKGFEIAFHGATMESSVRARTERGLEVFREHFGTFPSVHCNHGQNRENLYWGASRYRTFPARAMTRFGTRWRSNYPFEGHLPESPYFWGDLAQQRIRYVRNLAFKTLNTARIYPGRAFHLSSTPFVRNWFHSSDAPDVTAFNQLVTEERLERLEQKGGYCILSTHLGKGFVKEGSVDPGVEERLRMVAERKGWFVPVSDLLDFLETGPVSPIRYSAVELWHLLDRLISHR